MIYLFLAAIFLFILSKKIYIITLIILIKDKTIIYLYN